MPFNAGKIKMQPWTKTSVAPKGIPRTNQSWPVLIGYHIQMTHYLRRKCSFHNLEKDKNWYTAAANFTSKLQSGDTIFLLRIRGQAVLPFTSKWWLQSPLHSWRHKLESHGGKIFKCDFLSNKYVFRVLPDKHQHTQEEQKNQCLLRTKCGQSYSQCPFKEHQPVKTTSKLFTNARCRLGTVKLR